jgi:cytochrome c556
MMKKLFSLLLVVIMILSTVAISAAKMEEIPKIMVLRLVTMQKLISQLALSDFEGVKKTADKFAATVKSNTGILPSEGLKEANTKLEKAVEEFSQAVSKKNPSEITARFGGMIAACYGCHSKFRD